MLLIFGLFSIFIFGYLLSNLFLPRIHVVERIGLSFLLGLGVFTFIIFCYSIFGVKISLQSVLLSLGTVIVSLYLLLSLFKRKLSFKVDMINFFKKTSSIEKAIILVILSVLTASFTIATYFPVYIWDALAIYDFRGRVIADTGLYMQIARNFYWFDGYPLFTSLSHTLVYLFGGENPQFLYSFIYSSFVFVFYGNIRRFVERKNALLTSLLLTSIPLFFNHSTFAYTNLPYSVFITLSTFYLYIWFAKKGSYGHLIVSAILLGLSCWTRSTEPFWVVNLLVLLFFIGVQALRLSLGLLLRKWNNKFTNISLICGMQTNYKIKDLVRFAFAFVIYFLILFSFREPWILVNRYVSAKEGSFDKTVNITNEIGSYASLLSRTPIDTERIYEVANYIYTFIIRSWYPVLFIFLFSIILNLKKLFRKQSTFFLFIIMLYFGVLLYGTYIYTFGPSSWRAIPDSARRMAMFFIPLMVYYIGLKLAELSNQKK